MKRLLIISSLILIIASISGTALAQSANPNEDRVVIGGNLTLEEGDQVEGSVVVFGGNFFMEEGSEVEGDVAVFGGCIDINGKVEGSIAGIGGDIILGDEAEIEGDVAGLGSTLTIDREAKIDGTITDGLSVEYNTDSFAVQVPPDSTEQGEYSEATRTHRIDRGGFVSGVIRFFGDGILDIITALLIAGLCVLITLFFPSQTHIVQQTLQAASPISFLVGLLTFIAAVATTFILGILFWLILPVCGIIFLVLALAGACLLGWSALGRIIGERVFHHFENPSPSAVSSTLLGVVILSLMWRMPFLNELPWIGWLFWFTGSLVFILFGSTGLGAVILSRFGTKIYNRSPPSSTVLPKPDRV